MASRYQELRRFLSPALASLLLLMTSLAPALDARAAAAPAQQAALKGQLLEIPMGSQIEIRLVTKEKIRGQLASVADDGVSVKTLTGSTIEEKRVAFDQMVSVKQVRKGLPFVAKVFIGVGIGIGIFFGIAAIACGANYC